MNLAGILLTTEISIRDGKLLCSELQTHDIDLDLNFIHQQITYTSSAGNLSDRCHKQRVGRTHNRASRKIMWDLWKWHREGKSYVLLLQFSVSTEPALQSVVRSLLLSVWSAQ